MAKRMASRTALLVVLIAIELSTQRYQNATIAFSSALKCESCIRGGYDYCSYSNLDRNCSQSVVQPSSSDQHNCTINTDSSEPQTDQITAIVQYCEAIYQKARHPDCGDYLVKLTNSSNQSSGPQFRSIKNLPVGTSCTYRANSKCGFPQAKFTMVNFEIDGDFDIAFASLDGMRVDEELTFYNPHTQTDWNGTMQSDQFPNKFAQMINQPANKRIDNAVWTNCTSIDRNLFITITRTRASDALTLQSGSLFQSKPNDLDIVFQNYQGQDPEPPSPPAKPIKVFTIGNISDTSVDNTTF